MRGTVKSKDDMERLFREGRRSSSYLMNVIVAPAAGTNPQGRWAFIAGKKLGCAPLRSRCKRVMRAAAAELGGPWPQLDVVFVARSKIATAEHQAVLKDMSKCLGKLGVVDAKR